MVLVISSRLPSKISKRQVRCRAPSQKQRAGSVTLLSVRMSPSYKTLFFDTESRVSLCCPGCPHTHGLPASVSLLSGSITDMPHPYQKSLKIFQLTQTQVSYSLHWQNTIAYAFLVPQSIRRAMLPVSPTESKPQLSPKNWHFLPKKPSTANSSLARGTAWQGPALSILEFDCLDLI